MSSRELNCFHKTLHVFIHATSLDIHRTLPRSIGSHLCAAAAAAEDDDTRDAPATTLCDGASRPGNSHGRRNGAAKPTFYQTASFGHCASRDRRRRRPTPRPRTTAAAPRGVRERRRGERRERGPPNAEPVAVGLAPARRSRSSTPAPSSSSSEGAVRSTTTGAGVARTGTPPPLSRLCPAATCTPRTLPAPHHGSVGRIDCALDVPFAVPPPDPAPDPPPNPAPDAAPSSAPGATLTPAPICDPTVIATLASESASELSSPYVRERSAAVEIFVDDRPSLLEHRTQVVRLDLPRPVHLVDDERGVALDVEDADAELRSLAQAAHERDVFSLVVCLVVSEVFGDLEDDAGVGVASDEGAGARGAGVPRLAPSKYRV